MSAGLLITRQPDPFFVKYFLSLVLPGETKLLFSS